MRLLPLYAMIFLSALFFGGPACAQAPAPEKQPKQIQLNPDIVQRFIVTLKEMKEIQQSMNKASGKKANDTEEDEGDALFTASTPEAAAKLNVVLKKHGFTDEQNWGEVVQSVMLAYGYSDPEGGLSDLDVKIQNSITEIENDQKLSAEQRKAAVENLKEEQASLKPLPGNAEIVKPFLPELRKIMENE